MVHLKRLMQWTARPRSAIMLGPKSLSMAWHAIGILYAPLPATRATQQHDDASAALVRDAIDVLEKRTVSIAPRMAYQHVLHVLQANERLQNKNISTNSKKSNSNNTTTTTLALRDPSIMKLVQRAEAVRHHASVPSLCLVIVLSSASSFHSNPLAEELAARLQAEFLQRCSETGEKLPLTAEECEELAPALLMACYTRSHSPSSLDEVLLALVLEHGLLDQLLPDRYCVSDAFLRSISVVLADASLRYVAVSRVALELASEWLDAWSQMLSECCAFDDAEAAASLPSLLKCFEEEIGVVGLGTTCGCTSDGMRSAVQKAKERVEECAMKEFVKKDPQQAACTAILQRLDRVLGTCASTQ